MRTVFTDDILCIEEIAEDDVHQLGKSRYNSCNHRNNGKPDDYFTVLEKTMTKYWIDKFHTNYKVIIIPNHLAYWFKDAMKLCSQTGKFSQLYSDELEEFLKSLDTGDIFDCLNTQGYFIRSEHVSLKCGEHGAGPYKSMKYITESILSSSSSHSVFNLDTDTELKLYLLPWKEIDTELEFRVFVNDDKITAISSQDIYHKNHILKDRKDDDRIRIIKEWMTIITEFFSNRIKPSIKYISSYTFDIALLENNQPYFIELNTFGSSYSAGSAGYHWLHDNNILYGKKEQIYFRYVN